MIHKHINLLYLFFPVAFILGPLAAEVLVAYINLYFLFNFNKFKKKVIDLFNENKILIIIIFIFFVTSIISSINASEKFIAFYKSFFHLRFYIFFIFTIIFCKYYFYKNRNLENYKKIYLLIFLFLSLSVLIEFLVHYLYEINIIDYRFQFYQYSRYSGLFGHELIAGSFLQKGLIFLLLFSLKFQSKFNFFFGTYLLLIIFLTGERIAFLYSLILYILVISANIKKVDLKKLLLFFFLIISIVYFSFQNSIHLKERYLSIYNHSLSLINSDERKNLDSPYFKLFSSGISVWKKNKLFGVGVRNYRIECKNYSEICSTHPHNYYLEILAENGILGIVLFILMLFFLIFVCKKTFFFKKENLLIIFCFLVLFTPLASTGSYYNNHNSSLLWLTISFLYFFKRYFYLIKY